MSKASISRAVGAGALEPVHRGVYALLPLSTLPALAREQAALLACAPRVLLSHRSAAALWGLLPRPPEVVEVTVVGRDAGRSRPGLIIHRAAALDRRDARRHERLPVTAPARTFLDLSPSLNDRELERAFDEALVTGVLRVSGVRSMLARHPGRKGVARLAALADEHRMTTRTRSDTEERFLALVRKAGLPAPEVNVSFQGFEVDFLWRKERVVVETDGYAFHSSRRAMERDHGRDTRLQAAGVLVLRFTWHQIVHEPEMVLVQVAGALARRSVA